MTKRRLLATTLAATLLIGGGLSWRLAETLVWLPADLSPYEEAALRDAPHQKLSRFLAERVSQHASAAGAGPVSGATMMSEVLSSFHDLLVQHDETTAILGSAAVFAVWDEAGAEAWLSGFEGITEALAKKEADPEARTDIDLSEAAQAAIDTRVAKSLTVRSFELTQPHRPDNLGSPSWKPPYGLDDPDFEMGSHALLHGVELADIAPPPEPGSGRDAVDTLQVRLASRLAGKGQIRNAIWWQGSGGYDKTPSSGGQNPSDHWQSIAFAHAARNLSEVEFARLSADLADVQRDALVAAWRVKYRDWAARPNMRDATLEPRVGNPLSPSHVSEHAAAGSAAAHLLAAQDPENAKTYFKLARDSALSRIWGGVHTASETNAGFEIGARVAAAHLEANLESRLRDVGGVPIVDGVILAGFEALLDGIQGAAQRLRQAAFDDISLADRSPLAPKTSTSGVGTDLADLFAGSIAAADLDGDGLKEVLVTGRDEIRLYQNTSQPGQMSFDLTWQAEAKGIAGAYFTQAPDGMVDGVLAFGTEAPRFYPRWEDLAFAPEAQIVHGIPNEDFAVQGVLFFDADGDGSQDALLLQTGFPVGAEQDATSKRGRRPNILLRRGLIGFSFEQYVENPAGSSVAGGHLDLTGDGMPERILVSDAGRTQIVDGASGADLPFNKEVDKIVFGASFTPIDVGGRIAFHLSNVHHGEEWPYDDPDRPEELDRDLLLAWDSEAGEVIDLAGGGLNSRPGEWGWGSAAGDLDGNGLSDLVILRGFSSNTPYPAAMRIFLQEPGGIFREQVQTFDFEGLYPRAVLLEDLDGDGDLDILASASQQLRMWENLATEDSASSPVKASQASGYLTQVVDSEQNLDGDVPPHIRPAAPEDFHHR